MHKNATKCNKILSKWCKNKHGASKIIDTFETYHTTFLGFWHGGGVLAPKGGASSLVGGVGGWPTGSM
jgi:hypothetical protein